jgi:hypothetical protein
MSHAMAAKKRGAKLVVVDPYRTGTGGKSRSASCGEAGHRRRTRVRR